MLSIGLMQTSLFALVPIVLWLALLHGRATGAAGWRASLFNAAQVLIVMFTLVVAGVLYLAVQQSLLGWPDMQIEGNGSSWRELNWYADRSGPVLPTATIVSLPLIVYRVLMLLWALWLAWAVLGWLRWAWAAFSAGGFWRPINWREFGQRRKAPAEPGQAGDAGGNGPDRAGP
ncbi:MAG: hypothetical protein R3E83_15830 [Burkholderiaceae bacterium]